MRTWGGNHDRRGRPSGAHSARLGRSRGRLRPWAPVALLAFAAVVAAASSPSAGPSVAGTRPARAGFDRVFIIPIAEEINDVTLESLKRRVDEAKEEGVDCIVFELNTPGGVATTALKICTLIKNLDPIHTVAWVNPDAYSAGAIIALACHEIVMSANSTIGDCQPIMLGPEGVSAIPEDVEAKFNSPLIKELRDSSHLRGHDLSMCMAMIRPDIELFWVEDTKTGERRFVPSSQRDELFGLADRGAEKDDSADADKSSKDDAPAKSGRRADRRIIEPVPDAQSTTTWRYVKSAPPLNKVHQPVVSRNELLTMSQDEAIAFGFAKARVASEAELRDFFGVRGSITRLSYSWTERFVSWLSSPMVRGVLFILMLLGAYAEFNHPGFGVPGIVALVCLLIFLGAPYLTGLAKAWEILVVICGVGLLLVELFLIPGFGITGIAGVLLIMIGFMATFIPEDPGPIYRPTFNYTVSGVKNGLWVIAIGLSASIAGMIALSRIMPRTPYFRRLIPPNPTLESVAVADSMGDVGCVGDIGRTEGPLRPAGKARFGSTLLDVVSDGEFLAPGEPVEVIDRQGTRVVVRRIRAK